MQLLLSLDRIPHIAQNTRQHIIVYPILSNHNNDNLRIQLLLSRRPHFAQNVHGNILFIQIFLSHNS
jgi:hypothetical protein